VTHAYSQILHFYLRLIYVNKRWSLVWFIKFCKKKLIELLGVLINFINLFLATHTFTNTYFYLIVSGCLLRDLSWQMGTQRPSNKRPGDDVHPVQLLQFHGGCRHLSSSDLCYPTASIHFPPNSPRQVNLVSFCCQQFILTVIFCCSFQVNDWLSLSPYNSNNIFIAKHNDQMLESFLTFLSILMSVRTNLGLTDVSLIQLEMVTLLCMGDKTHSQLLELMPERCGNYQGRDFESELSEVHIIIIIFCFLVILIHFIFYVGCPLPAAKLGS